MISDINKVEIKGTVGSIKKSANIEGWSFVTVCTNLVHNSLIDTTWHQIMMPDDKAYNLKKGDRVHIEGILKAQTYVTNTGEKRSSVLVIALKGGKTSA